jgi:hypothetical protein
MERQRDTGARMDALIQGADWARMAQTARTATARTVPVSSWLATERRLSRAFECRGRESNPHAPRGDT